MNTHVTSICTHLSLSSSTLASLPWRMNDDNKMKDDRVWKKPGITEDKELEFVEKVLQYIVGLSVCNQDDDNMMSIDFDWLSYNLFEIVMCLHFNCFLNLSWCTIGIFLCFDNYSIYSGNVLLQFRRCCHNQNTFVLSNHLSKPQ